MMKADDLNSAIEFECPFTIDINGELRTSHVYVPEVFIDDEGDIEILGDGWAALSGFTGQYGYNGPIMHPSEQLSGSMADRVVDTPGTYVVVAVTDYDDEEPAGWAVLYKTSIEKETTS